MSFSSVMQLNLFTLGGIVAVMALISVIEAAIPLHVPAGPHRAHRGPNLALTAIAFATNLLLNSALILLLAWLQADDFGILRWARLDRLTAGLISVLMLDFSFYVAHVAMHKLPLFWNIHRVHHSDPVVDVTTTVRQHPLEGIIRYTFMAACASALGVGLGAFSVYRMGSVLNGLLEHANLRVPSWLDRTLSLVTTWPNVHKVHHSRDARDMDTNYGNLFSWFDRLFSTYTPPFRGKTVVCGLDGFDTPAMQATLGLLAMPFAQPTGAAAVGGPAGVARASRDRIDDGVRTGEAS